MKWGASTSPPHLKHLGGDGAGVQGEAGDGREGHCLVHGHHPIEQFGLFVRRMWVVVSLGELELGWWRT